jgi:diaminopimelate decarboxylase
MDQFALRDGVLHAEDIPLPRIAEEVGTPVYVYSRAMLEAHAQEFRAALKDVPKKHLAFAIKSNPNLGVLRVLARQGYGADVVSGGELERAIAAGMAPDDIVSRSGSIAASASSTSNMRPKASRSPKSRWRRK